MGRTPGASGCSGGPPSEQAVELRSTSVDTRSDTPADWRHRSRVRGRAIERSSGSGARRILSSEIQSHRTWSAVRDGRTMTGADRVGRSGPSAAPSTGGGIPCRTESFWSSRASAKTPNGRPTSGSASTPTHGPDTPTASWSTRRDRPPRAGSSSRCGTSGPRRRGSWRSVWVPPSRRKDYRRRRGSPTPSWSTPRHSAEPNRCTPVIDAQQ